MAIDVDIAILGGGIGGLWVAYELVQRHYTCFLTDSHDLGSFASLRNQSWLHTGALYTVMGSTDILLRSSAKRMRDVCREGTNRIIEFCQQSAVAKDAIEHSSACFFLFGAGDEVPMRNAQRDLMHSGFNPESLLQEPDFRNQEPILHDVSDNKLKYCLGTNDLPFNAYKILMEITNKIFSYDNVVFYKSSTRLDALKEIQYHHDRDKWRIEDSSFGVVDARAVVCAAGVLNRWIFNRVTRRNDFGGMIMKKCLVLVLNKRICNRIIVIRNQASGFLNLVPFADGTTINLGGYDEEAESFSDTDPFRAFNEDVFKDIARSLNDFVPGLREMSGCEVRFYVCQKLDNTIQSCLPPGIHGMRHYFWIENGGDAPKFFFYYPGKFTLAPVGAKELVDKLSEKLLGPSKQVLPKGETPCVSSRPYLDPPTHVIRASSRTLELQPIGA